MTEHCSCGLKTPVSLGEQPVSPLAAYDPRQINRDALPLVFYKRYTISPQDYPLKVTLFPTVKKLRPTEAGWLVQRCIAGSGRSIFEYRSV